MKDYSLCVLLNIYLLPSKDFLCISHKCILNCILNSALAVR